MDRHRNDFDWCYRCFYQRRSFEPAESQIEVFDALSEEFDAWEDLLSDMSDEQITTPRLPSNLSIKDVIAHLRAWQQRSIARLEAALLGRAPEFPKWPAELDPEPALRIQQLRASPLPPGGARKSKSGSMRSARQRRIRSLLLCS